VFDVSYNELLHLLFSPLQLIYLYICTPSLIQQASQDHLSTWGLPVLVSLVRWWRYFFLAHSVGCKISTRKIWYDNIHDWWLYGKFLERNYHHILDTNPKSNLLAWLFTTIKKQSLVPVMLHHWCILLL